MAPKGKKKQDEEGSPEPTEALRLKTRAMALGLLAPDQPAVIATLPLSKAMIKCNGQDIIKKSSVRKNRYLIILNCLLAPAAAGKLGSLSKLDTKEPLMYIDFKNGRLKLFGSLVFPKNKYIVLKPGGNAGVLCEDVFETLLVFSESWWVGTKEENPSEERLPLPPELQMEQVHTNYEFDSGAGGTGTVAPTTEKKKAAVCLPSTQNVNLASQAPVQPDSAARPRRAAAQRSYADALGSDDEGGAGGGRGSEDEGEEPQGVNHARTMRTVRAPLSSDLGDEEGDELGPRKALGQLGSASGAYVHLFDELLLASRPGKEKARARPARGGGNAERSKARKDSDEDEYGDMEEDSDELSSLASSSSSGGEGKEGSSSGEERGLEEQEASPPPPEPKPKSKPKPKTEAKAPAPTKRPAPAKPANQKPASQKKRKRKGSDSENEADPTSSESAEEEDSEEEGPKPAARKAPQGKAPVAKVTKKAAGKESGAGTGGTAKRLTARASAAKRPKYADDSDEEEASEEPSSAHEDDSDFEAEERPAKRPAKRQAKAPGDKKREVVEISD